MGLTACAQVTITHLYFNYIPPILELHIKVNNKSSFKKEKYFGIEMEGIETRALDSIKEYDTNSKEFPINSNV